MKYNELVDTLQNLTDNKEIKQTDIIEIIGINETDLTNRINNNTDFSELELKFIGDYFNVDLVDFDKVNTILESMIKEDKEAKKLLPGEVIKINYYSDANAICSNGRLADDLIADKLAIPVSFINNYDKADVYSVIPARSNSIEPLIMPDDLIIVKHTDTIEDNKIHIFTTDNKITCNYLHENSDEQYDTIYGVVVASIRKF